MDEKYVAKLMKSIVEKKTKMYLQNDLDEEGNRIARKLSKDFVKSKSTEIEKAFTQALEKQWPELLKKVVAAGTKGIRLDLNELY